MRWPKLFITTGQPIEIINRWLNVFYCLVLVVLAVKIGISLRVIALSLALLLLHFGSQQSRGQGVQRQALTYFTLLLEFILLLVLAYGAQGEWVGTIFLLYTASVMLNYPAVVALPFIYTGYFLYLLFLNKQAMDFNAYVFNLINFSLTPLSLLGVRTLIVQRQRILDLNQRLQSQAELSAEMSKLRERNSLAEAMHDTIGHTLTASIVSLEGVALLLETRPEEAAALLESVREQLQAGLGDIRQTVRSLKTDTLGEHGALQESLRQLVARVNRQTAVDIELHFQMAVDLLPIQEYVLYTLTREAITNALKHSQATHIQITLAEVAQKNCIALTVEDNGQGANSFQAGFGLTHLEQKVQALGGRLSIETQAQAGFRLQALLPLALDVLIKPLKDPKEASAAYD
ncbi:MAG: sensor histidine kinase [Chloroflexi bacterium]|nr:sensor histidine kinase [Chloroflexota bacterium]